MDGENFKVVLPKLAADVMYLSPVVKRTGSVNVLVPRWFPAFITHSYVDPSFKPVMRRLVALVSFLDAVREPTCLQKTLQRNYLRLNFLISGWCHCILTSFSSVHQLRYIANNKLFLSKTSSLQFNLVYDFHWLCNNYKCMFSAQSAYNEHTIGRSCLPACLPACLPPCIFDL